MSRRKDSRGTGWITSENLKSLKSKTTNTGQLEYAVGVVFANRELAENIRGVMLTSLPDIMEGLLKQSRLTQTKRDEGRNSGIETRTLEKRSRNKSIRHLRFKRKHTYQQIREEMGIKLCNRTLFRICKNETLS